MTMSKEKLQHLLDQAKSANNAHQYSEAESHALQIINYTGSDLSDEFLLEALYELCKALVSTNKDSDLLKYGKLGLERSENSLHPRAMWYKATFLNALSNAYNQSVDYAKSMEVSKQALEIFKQIGDKNGIASLLCNLGVRYTNLSEYAKAIEHYKESLEIYTELENQPGIALTTGNIGMVFSRMGENEKAIKFLKKANDQGEDLGDKSLLARNNGNIGVAYYELSDYETAMGYFEKALEMSDALGNKMGVAMYKCNIGVLHKMMKDYQSAFELCRSAYDINEEIGQKRMQTICTMQLGEILANKEYDGFNPIEAEKYMQKAVSLAVSIEARSEEKDARKKLAEFYKQNQRWEEALGQRELQYKIVEEIQSEEAKKQAQRFDIEYKIQEREKEIAVERAASQAKQEATTGLLYRVLPDVIANRILEGEEEIADYFPAVSVLFADICGFTPMTTELPAYLLVRLLNSLFNRFDAAIQKHGCTKIKTIGDGYMAVAGAPESCEDHAERLIRAALEMIKPIEIPAEIEAFLPDDAKLEVRIGMHTGPVVAGVVGEERFMYDIYSDAVNIASRMETHGEAGKIHVSAHFMRHLLDSFAMTNVTDHGLSFEKRGEIEVKGKGRMKTFFLEKKSSDEKI